ncbi:MarR family transcriptional regulator [Henriciella barbarensis]|uniref:MarR family transcriptional regulator n=1 Tax=Henriciella barbarensis TaxID=86342 RepID=A0A399R4B5_9PROT|nr:MarR family transcriptional regulator [Henriciella barbarensis]RIJ24269.1 MarR family transcriptional regulator [Henriciella barbarensis]
MTDERCAGIATDDHDAISVLREVGRLAHMTDCAVAACLPSPVTVAQYAVLNTLAAGDGLSITQLAEIHTVSQPTMSSTVAKLRARGLVEARSKPGDRRSRFVLLTKEGADIKASCDTAAEPLLNGMAARISSQDWISLQKIVAGLNGHLAEALNASGS